VYVWREGSEPERIDEPPAVPDSRVPLTISADGRQVSWRGYVWHADRGIERALVDIAAPGESGARMSLDGRSWTFWLPDGPEGPGLYRQRSIEGALAYFPLLAHQ
jgi:hypothetical protein